MQLMDNLDRDIMNVLQGGFPVCDRPYLDIAQELGTSETGLINRLQSMLDDGRLSRFGPMYNAEKFGGAFTLCAISVPESNFEETAEIVNQFIEVAHNYQREHEFNMWFVVATEFPHQIETVIANIEQATGCRVYNFPKLEEFYIGLKLNA